AKQCPGCLIIRTNIYGWNIQPRPSLAEWIFETLTAGQVVTGFQDVFFSPILVNDLSDTLLDMLREDCGGVYHVAGSETVSKADFARGVAREFGLNEHLVQDVSIRSKNLAAARPRDTSLNVTKAELTLGRALPGVRKGLSRFRQLREDGFAVALKAGSKGPGNAISG
ncbi:MAG: sugar nucleotide-binding protein, partial [Chloroflexi bacterium]|nr:sugar nucleotide-binding protein [Chloroflexota bacterium]